MHSALKEHKVLTWLLHHRPVSGMIVSSSELNDVGWKGTAEGLYQHN